MGRIFVRDKSFYRAVLLLALPVVAQNMINIGVNIMDTYMLGSYGVEPGFYVMLPAYGPTTPRQAIGSAFDLSWIIGPWSLAKTVVQAVDGRAKAIDKEALLDQAQDPYVTFREAYYQNLEYRAKDGNIETKSETLSQEELNEID